MRLQDKVVLITSAQNPCAKAIVTGFAREGTNCAIVDEDASKAEQLAAEVRALGRRALPLQFDVTKKSQVEEAVRRTVAEFGHMISCSTVHDQHEAIPKFHRKLSTNLSRGPKPTFLLPGRPADGRSALLENYQLSTTDARIGSGESTGNSAAYSSIESMTRAIAQALGFYGVNVNSLVCGPMDSFSGTAEEIGERLRRMPLGRLGKPEDLVGAAIFLATDDSNFVAGESLYVDAGYSNAAVTEDGFRPAWGRTWGKFEVPPRNK